MNKTEYAIVDIETTGGPAAAGSITEIAIRIFDGKEITRRFDTLIRPGQDIPLYITVLTGIDNGMVRDSPAFEEVAAEIFALLQGRVFVAHNVHFDYTFLRQHLEEAGYRFTAQRLCTVRMARKIKPGLRSYSLGNLCEALAIPLENRHRAGGDADATVILFAKLLEWDTAGVLAAMLKKGSGEQQLPPNLPGEHFGALPEKPGVYYFRDAKGQVIYVGKAKNIRKRVAQHFTGHNPRPQRQNFMRDIHAVDFEPCGTELMAFILECLEIKRIWPKYNRALKKYEPKFGLFTYEDLQGYKRLLIGKYNRGLLPVQVFTTRETGVSKLYDLARRFGLCPSLCRLGSCALCGTVDKKADLVCTANEPAAVYNEKVDRALSYLKEDMPGFYIMDKGRNGDEKSCIWVEHGNFYGMGYIDNTDDIRSAADVKDRLTRYEGNHYIMQLIISFVCKNPAKVFTIEHTMA
ncbi:MAG TPA: exonuclease domain-containing protein [Edaphocola sp.]|nr:exonuclease domain-containing protein [Edaphocola sp.]